MLAPLRLVLAHRALRGLGLVAFAYVGCQSSVGAFFVLHLTQSVGMPLVQAGLAFAVLQTGGVCGRIIWGAVAGRFVSSRKVLAILGFLTTISVAALTALTPAWSFVIVCILGFILGSSSFGWNGIFLSEVAGRAPEGKISEATSGAQIFVFSGIVVIPPIFGVVVNVANSYAVPFLVVAALTLIASLYLATLFSKS